MRTSEKPRLNHRQLVAHDGIGAFLVGVLLAVSIEGYRWAN